jgi:hypothetical protein
VGKHEDTLHHGQVKCRKQYIITPIPIVTNKRKAIIKQTNLQGTT